MPTTLITFLGKSQDKGYRPATYDFGNDECITTPFFGLALSRHLKADIVHILGTAGSMWDVLVESFNHHDDSEEVRLELMDAKLTSTVSQSLLDRITPLVQIDGIPHIKLHIIPEGRSSEEQIGILQIIANMLGSSQSQLHIDVTHGFRHLAAVGFLSASMLERIHKQQKLHGLWYGALEMTQNNITPVVRLAGLQNVQQWTTALDIFNASGDYGVFAPLLVNDGVDENLARCLKEAAFHDRLIQTADAARKLRTFLPALNTPLNGASRLFQDQLRKKLAWANEDSLAEQQRLLALQAIARGDVLRSAILGQESLLTRHVMRKNGNYLKYKDRNEAETEIQQSCKNDGLMPEWYCKAFNTLKAIRNSLAHGTPSDWEKIKNLLKNHDNLQKEIRSILDKLNTDIK